MDATLTASEFKAKCLEIFDRVASGELEHVVVTKRGRVVGILHPPEKAIPDAESLLGCMHGSVSIPADWDPSEPSCTELFDAERVILHR